MTIASTAANVAGEEFAGGVIGRAIVESKSWWPEPKLAEGDERLDRRVPQRLALWGCYGSTVQTRNSVQWALQIHPLRAGVIRTMAGTTSFGLLKRWLGRISMLCAWLEGEEPETLLPYQNRGICARKLIWNARDDADIHLLAA